MSKLIIDILYIKQSLENIGYIINECIERNNNGVNWQVKFTNSGAIATIYDTNTKENTVVNGKVESNEQQFLKGFIDSIKCNEKVVDPLNKTIVNLINSKKESTYYDFKESLSEYGPDLLHDILCMVNNIDNQEAYLIYGVSDNFAVVGSDKKIISNNLNDFLRNISFAGDNQPQCEVKHLYYKSNDIDVIVINKSKKVPHYITVKYKGVFENQIYTRNGDSNTPKNKHANYDQVVKLWKIHFS